MSKKGGYKIVDLKGTSLTSGTEATIVGMYDAIESTNKRTIISGLVVGSTEYDDFPVLFTVSGTSFVATQKITGATIDIVVADDDGVTVTVTSDPS